MEELQDAYDSSKYQLLLAWLSKHPSEMIPIIGTSKLKRLEPTRKAFELN